jgi:hypothetical protein
LKDIGITDVRVIDLRFPTSLHYIGRDEWLPSFWFGIISSTLDTISVVYF